MEIVVIGARVLLALIFLVAGLAKLADLAGSRKSMIDFGVPKGLAPAFGLLLPLWEIALGIALFPRATAWRGGFGALALLLIFIAGIIYNLAKGRAPDCHCFGKLHSAPIGWKTIARNLVFCALAAAVVWHGPQQPALLGWAARFNATQLSIIALVVICVAILWLMVQMIKQNGRMLLRIEALENQLKPKPQVPAGDFKGRKTVFLFWNPDCGFCLKMLDDVKAWENAQSANAPRLVIVSSGTIEATQAQGFRSTIVHGVGESGTPSAVMADPDGNIISDVAIGAVEVMNTLNA
jgi:uncharacterized membrane protein YphA (DoxX/SURF4 family)